MIRARVEVGSEALLGSLDVLSRVARRLDGVARLGPVVGGSADWVAAWAYREVTPFRGKAGPGLAAVRDLRLLLSQALRLFPRGEARPGSRVERLYRSYFARHLLDNLPFPAQSLERVWSRLAADVEEAAEEGAQTQRADAAPLVEFLEGAVRMAQAEAAAQEVSRVAAAVAERATARVYAEVPGHVTEGAAGSRKSAVDLTALVREVAQELRRGMDAGALRGWYRAHVVRHLRGGFGARLCVASVEALVDELAVSAEAQALLRRLAADVPALCAARELYRRAESLGEAATEAVFAELPSYAAGRGEAGRASARRDVAALVRGMAFVLDEGLEPRALGGWTRERIEAHLQAKTPELFAAVRSALRRGLREQLDPLEFEAASPLLDHAYSL